MARLATLALAGFMAGAESAAAQTVHHESLEPPLYPEIILETDDSFSDDPELSAFRRALAEAAGYRWGRPLDPEAVLPFLAAEVEFFIGQKGRGFREAFVSLGHHPARRALEMAGRLTRGSDSADSSVQSRYGLYVLEQLVMEPTVGRTPWLDGRICTASYGRISWPDWIALDGKLRFIDREHWVIASVVTPDGMEGLPVAGWPKPYQMVPVAPEQKRSGGSLGIIHPDGGVVFFSTFHGSDASHFAPYLNSHLCFEEREGAWKVSVIAMRLD
ncbi:hypothetical protein EJC49_05780 [Aquibium carbonis]|uniref:Uncharacterized protein n=1 Tax=Aquibium carbonis TaxID=2495581 RepID=A0A3S0GAA7_9HYPH|nr:hypothetical protein [Aquibium carbonis]RST87313.1 hypothetical protein EJC49_05780 [Aquibium carbonis]